MNTHTRAGLLGLALAASAGLADAGETTSVFRQGNSTATITQDGEGSTTRRVIRRGADSQTIIQSQGGNSARITQSSGRSKVQRARASEPEGRLGRLGRAEIVVTLSASDQADLRALAREEDTSVQALVEEAIQDLLDSQ